MKKLNHILKMSFLQWKYIKFKTIRMLNRPVKLTLLFIFLTLQLHAQVCNWSFGGYASGTLPIPVLIKDQSIGIDSSFVGVSDWCGWRVNKLSEDSSALAFIRCGSDDLNLPVCISYFCYAGGKYMSPGWENEFCERIIPRNPVSFYGYVYADTISLGENVYLHRDDTNPIVADFGDGTVGSHEFGSLYHTYTDTGLFHIKAAENHDVLKVYVKCPGENPWPYYIFYTFPGKHYCINEPVTFNPDEIMVLLGDNYPKRHSIAPITTTNLKAYFIFGDSVSAPNQKFTLRFNKSGAYPVTLKITNVCGDVYTDTFTINVNENAKIPLTDFCSDQYNVINTKWNLWTVCPGVPAPFSTTDFCIFTDAVSRAKWDMGDGTIVYSPSFKHTYNNAGTYPVSVTAYNGCGDSVKRTSTVKVEAGTPGCSISFKIKKKELFVGEGLSFSYINHCRQDVTEQHWDFGDGNTSDEESVVHSYQNPGTYTITLKISRGCGESSHNYQVIVRSIDYQPAISIVAVNDCGGPLFHFYLDHEDYDEYLCFLNDNSNSVKWNFGDSSGFVYGKSVTSHKYRSRGTYNVSAEFTDKCGRSALLNRTVTFQGNPFPETHYPFSNVGSIADSIVLVYDTVVINVDHVEDIFTSAIDFGDGRQRPMHEFIYVLPTIKHVYQKPGIYNVVVSSYGYGSCGTLMKHSKKITVMDIDSGFLPVPWRKKDVGSVGIKGFASYDSGTFTITGSGVDIWSKADGFRYVYQPCTGDVEIIARVASQQNVHPFAKAGIMIRENLNAGSKYASILTMPLAGITFQRRTTTDGYTGHTGFSGSAPLWMRLFRRGNTFTGYISFDGTIWTQVGSVTIDMSNNVYIGMAVSSHNNALSGTANFDHVSVSEKLPSPWATSDVGSVLKNGGVIFNNNSGNNSFTLFGSGDNIWSTKDAFRYVYQKLSGNRDITTRVLIQPNVHPFALAGLMIRNDLSAGSKHVSLFATPRTGLTFESRTTTNGYTNHTNVSGAAPVWLRISRKENNFNAYYSSDGVGWTQIDSTINIDMINDVYVGLAVCSHNSSLEGFAIFDHVNISSDLKSSPFIIEPISGTMKAVIWPNPANNLVNVQTETRSKISINDIHGVPLISKPIEAGITEMPLTLSPGIYMVQIISDDNEVDVIKLIVE